MYYKIITSTSNWKCPATGTYKIIVVGKGGDGADNAVGCCGGMAEYVCDINKDTIYSCYLTGNTAFGSLVSTTAGGSRSVDMASSLEPYAAGGDGGYTFDGVYGGNGALCSLNSNGRIALPATKNGGAPGATGLGYGAGGGCTNTGSANSHTSGNGGCVIIIGM